jgi:hypothetical protein
LQSLLSFTSFSFSLANRAQLLSLAFRHFVPLPAALPRLQLLQRPRPILLKELRQSPVGQQAAAGLAGGAVVGLAVGIDDPLHRRAADGAGLAEAAVDRHLFVEGGHLLRKTLAGLRP